MAPWVEAVAVERRCLLLVAGLGVDSNVLGPGTERALNLLAARGAVAGGVVEVTDPLAVYVALGVEAATARADQIERLTRPNPPMSATRAAR